MITHGHTECEHGVTVTQCRCIQNHTTNPVVVPCPPACLHHENESVDRPEMEWHCGAQGYRAKPCTSAFPHGGRQCYWSVVSPPSPSMHDLNSCAKELHRTGLHRSAEAIEQAARELEAFRVEAKHNAEMERNPLVAHARSELERRDEEPEFTESLIEAIKGFLSFGHSGVSAMIARGMLDRLLACKNLTPLTFDPVEWEDRSAISGTPLWQNRRNSTVFSNEQPSPDMREHAVWSVDSTEGVPPVLLDPGEPQTLQEAKERGLLADHGHPEGEACDEPDCYQAWEMYPDG